MNSIAKVQKYTYQSLQISDHQCNTKHEKKLTFSRTSWFLRVNPLAESSLSSVPRPPATLSKSGRPSPSSLLESTPPPPFISLSTFKTPEGEKLNLQGRSHKEFLKPIKKAREMSEDDY
jgi:hypothetical protein